LLLDISIAEAIEPASPGFQAVVLHPEIWRVEAMSFAPLGCLILQMATKAGSDRIGDER
jgi:hypothetical protein